MALREFARFAEDIISPTNRAGDVQGAVLDPTTRKVSTPPSFQSVYGKFVASGWNAATFPERHGGGGLPSQIGAAIQEMFASANVALSLNPILTQGAIHVLLEWGSDQQQSRYVPRMLTGEWCGTMNLTEAEAGSDLGAVSARAVRNQDGTWRVSGTKLFITWGDHDLADNIIHLVLARSSGAPPGPKGLSLFLVPSNDLKSNAPNEGVRCARVEKKLGLHGSPTCLMEYDDAAAELVGPEGAGLTVIFTMMNAARLSIGLQGPAVTERAFQCAYRYAAERRQGRVVGAEHSRRAFIVEHPDVRRMLLSMRTSVLATRGVIYLASDLRDLARHAGDVPSRTKAHALLGLLTPIAKAWSSDMAVAATSDGLQVLGGSGYIEECGMAQHFRDARIGPIYEGSNGIQAIDLVMRKIPQGNGDIVRRLLQEIADEARATSALHKHMSDMGDAVNEAVAVSQVVTERMLERITEAPKDALSGATRYLELLGLTLGGWHMLRRAVVARNLWEEEADRVEVEGEFFASEHLSRCAGLGRAALAGSTRLSSLSCAS